MTLHEETEPRMSFTFIRRWWWVILLCTAAAAATAYTVTHFIPASYRATATLLIEPSRDLMTNDYSGMIAAEQLALTYSHLLVEEQILNAVIAKTGVADTPEELSERITAEPVRETQLIQLSVKDPSPERAALLAKTVAEVFVAHVQSLEVERYGSALEELQEKIDSKSAQIGETQAKIEDLTGQSIASGAELARLQGELDNYRGEYQVIQQNFLSMQLASSQAADKVHIVETAYTRENKPKGDFTAIVTLLIDPALIIGEGTYSAVPTSDRVVYTYGQIWTGLPVLKAAVDRLGIAVDPEALAENVAVEAVPNTQLIRLKVTDTDAARAEALADAIGEIIVGQIQVQLSMPYTEQLNSMTRDMQRLSTSIAAAQAGISTASAEKNSAEIDLARNEKLLAQYSEDQRQYQSSLEDLRLTARQASNAVVVVTQPRIPEKPTQERLISIFLAGLIGLMIGAAAAFLIDRSDESIRTREDITQKLGMAHLGTVEELRTGDVELIMLKQPRSRIAESFRTLGLNIRFSNPSAPLRTLIVTSPGISDGKSVITANLGIALARLGLRVVVVDGDLRLPRLHRIFEVDQVNGLSNALESGGLDESLKQSQETGLKVLTSGTLPANPSELFSSTQLPGLLEELSRQADLVLIDCPPLLSVADSLVLAAKADGVLLVLRARKTTRTEAREAVEILEQVGANLIGAVLNGASPGRDPYSRYYTRQAKKGSSQPWSRHFKEVFAATRKTDASHKHLEGDGQPWAGHAADQGR